MPLSMKRLLHEPLVHFMLIGAGVFVLFDLAGGSDPEPDALVVNISQNDIERLQREFQATWRRPAQQEELDALVSNLVREEVLVREARALRMDQGDAVIRNRLRQKMDFIAASTANARMPEGKELREFFEANRREFLLPARFSFEQVLLDSRQAENVPELLSLLNRDQIPDELRNMSLLPAEIHLTSDVRIDGIFGSGFADRLAEQPAGVWVGPVSSGYGLHLVRINERADADLPAFEDVQEDVLTKWRGATQATAKEEFGQSLESKYEISISPLPESDE